LSSKPRVANLQYQLWWTEWIVEYFWWVAKLVIFIWKFYLYLPKESKDRKL